MTPREETANHILAAYGELGFRLAAAMITRAGAAEAAVTRAAASCDDPADWLGFLSRVRERAALWIESHPEDATRATAAALPASSPTALDFSVLPVDGLSAHEATAKLDEQDRQFLFDVLLGRAGSSGTDELESRLAGVLMNLHAQVREGNFPAAEDIP